MSPSRDALAYAAWAGKELPTEAEWEFAARGGLDGAEFAWGDELTPGGKHMANTWQGEFPHQNLLRRTASSAPRRSRRSRPNGYGLYDMIGNVWEWTTDWYSQRHEADAPKACCVPENPRGGSRGARATIRSSRTSRFRAKCLKADRICARRTTAAAIARPRVTPSRSILQQAISDFGVSSEPTARKQS